MVGDGLVGELVGGEFLQPTTPPPGDLRVYHCAAHIVVKRRAILDLAPGQVGLHQRRLNQVLRIGHVSGERERHPQQRGPAPVDVRTELPVVGCRRRLRVIVGHAHGYYLT
jgi:hypothetical protein